MMFERSWFASQQGAAAKFFRLWDSSNRGKVSSTVFRKTGGYTLYRRSACERTGRAGPQEIEEAADNDELARSLCYFW